MTLRHALFGLVMTLTMMGPAPAAQERDGAQPNIVLIVIDDLGWTDLGCYGSDFHETPNIDRLGSEGVRFRNAYSASSVCTPARASIMTGQWPARLHMTDWNPGIGYPQAKLAPPAPVRELPHAVTTLPEALQAAGYACLHVGKWHLGGAGSTPLDHGFDVNVGGSEIGGPATYWHPYSRLQGAAVDRTVRPLPPGGEDGEYLTDRLTDEAIKLVRAERDRPFFLHLAYYAVHTPLEAPHDLVLRYEAKAHPSRRHNNTTYAAMLHSVDANIGRLLETLREMDLEWNTVVILLSDNGGAAKVTDNSPLRGGKGMLYEGGVRVPLIARWPGVILPGAWDDSMVSTIDIAPTVMEIAGLKSDAMPAMDGRSLVRVLRHAGELKESSRMFWHSPHYTGDPDRTSTPCAAMLEGDWKLVLYFEDDQFELYDLRSDPGEQQSLVSTNFDHGERMKATLTGWLKQVDAQLPGPNPNYLPKRPFEGKRESVGAAGKAAP